LWAQAFAEQDGLNKDLQGEGAGEPAQAAAPAAPPAEASEEDLWAQAFAEQDGLNKGLQGEGAGEPAQAAAPAAPPAETGEEDLWAQAFAEQDGLNKDLQGEGAGEEAGESAEVAVEAAEAPGGETAEDLEEEELAEELEEAGVGAADYDLEEEGGELRAETGKKKLLGFIPLPTTKTGKLVLGGSMAALLLTLGGGYFAYKTFMPQKAAQKAEAVKQAADHKTADKEKAKDKKTETGEKAAAGKPEETAKPEDAAKPEGAVKPEETAKAEGEQPKSGDIAKDLKEVSKEGAELQKTEGGDKAPEAAEVALSAEKTTVALGTIMPVAFNPTDIRVLSFTLEMEFSSEETASMVRNNLPIYEKITVQTVEEFLQRKFYNDILYVKEKLQKKLEVAYNKSIQGGRVKKTKFKEFLIQ
ncbi:MAG: hypothetical protein HY580_04430, partial [Nitrospinae bacterium]|nr:hypothetical protein [Nitrospinota bacterium]